MANETQKIFEASAPGRLDVMGGIADYSGSLVLQMPIGQRTQVHLSLRDDYVCTLESRISTGEIVKARVDYRDFLLNNQINYAFAKEKFLQTGSTHWISYVVGCALVLQKEKGITFTGGDFKIQSEVPLGKGVSSSASIEVATMKVLTQAFGLTFNTTELPILAQRVENYVVGAPCGLMDQLACYLGQPKKILPILCQPDLIEESITIPEGVSFIGIDSGVRHSVSGASYSEVRCAAFMGYTIFLSTLGITANEIIKVKERENFSSLPYKGYLCNINADEFEKSIVHHLPHSILGKDFLAQYQVSIDRVTSIDPGKTYYIRQCVAHPVFENNRVNLFKKYLQSLNGKHTSDQTETLIRMGELMYQSHESYSLCGLGSDRTDEIVALAKNATGIYGAKITGGGNGGTVCLLVDYNGRATARKIHRDLCKKYQQDLIFFES